MNLKNYIKSGTQESSMRLGFLIVAFLCFEFSQVTIYVMYKQASNPAADWYGIAAIIGAIGALFGTSAYMKKEQRRWERNNEINNTPGDGPTVG